MKPVLKLNRTSAFVRDIKMTWISTVLCSSAPALLLFASVLDMPVAHAAQNTITSFEYDATGNPTKTTDPLGRVTTQLYDNLSRPVQMTQPIPATGASAPVTKQTYNLQDKLLAVTDPRALTTTYTVDGLANISKTASPDTGSTAQTFDAAGNMVTSTDARGKVTQYAYDAADRLISVTYPTGTPVKYTYDGPPTPLIVAKGRLTQMTDESGQTVIYWDRPGNVTKKTHTLANGLVSTITYAYVYGQPGSAYTAQSNHHIQTLTYPTGNQIQYVYDGSGRIQSLMLYSANSNGSGVPDLSKSISLINGATYQAYGPVAGWTWGNSTATNSSSSARGYDLDGRVQSYGLGNILSNGLRRTLTWDAASRITAITHTGTGTGSFAPGVYAQNYAYDGLDRLTQVGGSSQQSYKYDPNGNRIQSVFGSSTYTNAVAADSNRLTSASGPSPAKTYTYDADGNILSDGVATYTYSDRGRLASVKVAAGTVTYLYNGKGQRMQKTGPASLVPTGSVTYAYDEAGHLIGEYDINNKVIEETIYLGDIPVAVLTQTVTGTGSSAVTTTNIFNVYADHLNAPRVITRTSDNQIVWRWDYYNDPYGMAAPNQNPAGLGTFIYNLRFPGQVFDKETNLYHNGMRDYDAVAGRYVQSDPIGLKGGVNTYAYVGANPVSYVDASGLCVEDACIGEAVAVGALWQAVSAWAASATVVGIAALVSADSKNTSQQYVVRGGTCNAMQFSNGSGVSSGPDGSLYGVSVQTAPGATIYQLASKIKNGQIGVSTVANIEYAGGVVTPTPRVTNLQHADLDGLNSAQLQTLFQPTILNPVPSNLRGK